MRQHKTFEPIRYIRQVLHQSRCRQRIIPCLLRQSAQLTIPNQIIHRRQIPKSLPVRNLRRDFHRLIKMPHLILRTRQPQRRQIRLIRLRISFTHRCKSLHRLFKMPRQKCIFAIPHRHIRQQRTLRIPLLKLQKRLIRPIVFARQLERHRLSKPRLFPQLSSDCPIHLRGRLILPIRTQQVSQLQLELIGLAQLHRLPHRHNRRLQPCLALLLIWQNPRTILTLLNRRHPQSHLRPRHPAQRLRIVQPAQIGNRLIKLLGLHLRHPQPQLGLIAERAIGILNRLPEPRDGILIPSLLHQQPPGIKSRPHHICARESTSTAAPRHRMSYSIIAS